MKKVLRKLPLLVFLIAIVAGVVYAFLPQPEKADLARVTRGPMMVTIDEDGKTRIKQRYVITSPLAGKLRRIELKAGADLGYVYAVGQPLAVLEPGIAPFLDPRARDEAEQRKNVALAKREQSKELVKKAERQEQFARAEFQRVERSAAAGGSSRQERDEVELKLRVAERELMANRFAVQVAEFELKQARAVLDPAIGENGRAIPIPSPISKGKVLKVMQESERVVTPGAEIMELGDPDSLEGEFDVLTQDAVEIKEKARVIIENWGGKGKLEGTVRGRESGFMKQSALGVEEQRVNIIVDFTLPQEYHGRLGDGYRLEARIVIWSEADVLKVPSGALFREGKVPASDRAGQDKIRAVYVRENGRAVLKRVKIDHDNGREAEVLEGLNEGDEVILHPGDKIKPGVEIVPRSEK